MPAGVVWGVTHFSPPQTGLCGGFCKNQHLKSKSVAVTVGGEEGKGVRCRLALWPFLVSEEWDGSQTEPPEAAILQQRGHWLPDVVFVPLPPSCSSQATIFFTILQRFVT